MAIGILKAGVNSQDVTASTGTDVVDTVNYLYETHGLLLTANDQSYASANSLAIQAALDLTGSVDIWPSEIGGDIYIDSTLKIKSDTSLITKNGGVLKIRDGIPAILPICNEALYSTPASVTVTSVVNHVATISWTSHGLDIHSCVCLQGSDIEDYNLPFRIRRIVDADTIQVTLVAFTSLLPATSLSAYVMDKNINVDVSIDYNYAQTTLSGGYNAHGAVFAYIADSKIKVVTNDTAKYSCQVGGALNVDVDDSGSSNSDLLKIYGASRDITAKVSGNSSDDCLSVQGTEAAAFIAYQPAKGPIYNVNVTKISAMQNTVQTHGGSLVVYSDEVNTMAGVNFDSGSVGTSTTTALTIKPGVTFDPLLSKINDVRIGALSLVADQNWCVSITTGLKKLTFDGTIFKVSAVGGRMLNQSAGVIDLLTFKNLSLDLTNFAGSTIDLINITSTVKTIVFDNVEIFGTTANDDAKILNLSATALVDLIVIKNCNIESINRLINIAEVANVPIIYLDDCNINDLDYIVSTAKSCEVHIKSKITNVYRLINASDSINVKLFTESSSVAHDAIFRVSSGAPTLEIYSSTQPVNLSAVYINKVAGARCITNAARGTIPANRPVICDGTKWVDMTDTTLTYTPA